MRPETDTATIINDTECTLTWTNTQGDAYVLPPGHSVTDAIETIDHWMVTDGISIFPVLPQDGFLETLVLGCGTVDISVLAAPEIPRRIYKGVQRRGNP